MKRYLMFLTIAACVVAVIAQSNDRLLAAEDGSQSMHGDGTIQQVLGQSQWLPVYPALLATLDALRDKSWEIHQDAPQLKDQSTWRMVRETPESVLSVITMRQQVVDSATGELHAIAQTMKIRDTNLDGIPDEFQGALFGAEPDPDPDDVLLSNGFTKIRDDVDHRHVLGLWKLVLQTATHDLLR